MHRPKRRWFRFSLRGLLLAMALFALWIGWDASIVRQRRTALAAWNLRGGGIYIQGDTELSLVRRLLGDEAVTSILLPPDATGAELKDAVELFPEADVQR